MTGRYRTLWRLAPAVAAAAVLLHVPATVAARPQQVPDQAQLMVETQFVACADVVTDDGSVRPSATRSSAPGQLITAVSAGDGSAPPQAAMVTGGFGATALRLPAGSYWVFVPAQAADLDDNPDGILLTALPDGTPVRGWSAIDLPAGARARSTSLTVSIDLVSCAEGTS